MIGVKLSLCVSAAVLIAACRVGPQIDQLPAVERPNGARVEIDVRRGDDEQTLLGELLQTTSDELTILDADAPRVVTISWQVVTAVDAVELRGFRWRDTWAATRKQAAEEQLRLTSRYPQGLSEQQWLQLFAALGVEAAEAIRPK